MTTACALRWRVPDRILVGAWRGPCGMIAALERNPLTPIATIVTPPARGGGSVSVEAVTDDDVLHGQPLALDRTSGHLKLADPSYKPDAFVAGLARADTLAAFTADADQGVVELDDWTAVAGTPTLTPGAPYFLSGVGQISLTPPASPNCVAVIGVGFTTTALDVNPGVPLQL